MPFGRRAVIRLEHGGDNQSTEHYETVTYWYGAPFATLVHDGRVEDRRRRQRAVASIPFAASGRTLRNHVTLRVGPGYGGRQGGSIPPHTDTGRKTTGVSEFTLKLDPQNFGVLLRRKLDYSFPNQRAEVFDCGRDRRLGRRVQARRHLVSGWREHVRLLESEGGTGGHAAQCPDLQPPVPGR